MPYLRVPHLVVGERSGSGAVDLDQLPLEQMVALRSPSQAAEYLERTHTNLRLRAAPSDRAALLLVLNQEVSYAVLDEASLSLLLRESRFASLSIVGDIGLPQLLRLATRRDQPLLSGIVDRALQALPARVSWRSCVKPGCLCVTRNPPTSLVSGRPSRCFSHCCY